MQDLAQALEFYELLYDSEDGLEPTEFRLLKPGHHGASLSFASEPERIYEDLEELTRYNNDGYEIYAVINRIHPDTLLAIGNGKPTGKTSAGKDRYSTGDDHITGVRAVYVDMDTKNPGPMSNLELLESAPLGAHVIVNTSESHKLQAYWMIEGVSVAEFRLIQKALIKHFNSDTAIHNPSRIMRVPGFMHLKKEPILSRLIYSDMSGAYSKEAFLKAFDISLEPKTFDYTPAPVDPRTATNDWKRVTQAFRGWTPEDGKKHGAVVRALCLAALLAVPQARAQRDIANVMESWQVERDPGRSVPETAAWAYSQRGGPNVGQLVGNLRKTYKVKIPTLKAERNKVYVGELQKYSKRHDLTRVDQRRLGVTFRHGVNIIGSPMDTGKTYSIERLLAQDPQASVTYVSHLVSLAENAASRLGIDSYTEMEKQHYRIAPRLSICVNSLPHLISQESMSMPLVPDLLIVDEAEQVFRRLTDRTVQKKELLLSVLRYLITRARTVVIMDAHISDVSLKLLERWRPNERFQIIHNTHSVASGRRLNLCPSEGDALFNGLIALRDGHKVWFATNQKNSTAEGAFAQFKKEHPDKTFLLVSSDTTGDSEVQDFLKNPNVELAKYDGIIATPSINSGVSIDEGHGIGWVGGAFGGLSNTPSDVIQALGRVRGARELNVFVAERREELPVTPDKITRWGDSQELDMALMRVDLQTGQVGMSSPDYEALFVDVKINENKQRQDFRGHVLALALNDGYELHDLEAEARAAEIVKEARELAYTAYVDGVLAAPDIVEDEAKRMRTPVFPLTMAQTRALERYDLKTFYNISDEMLREAAVEDGRGKLRNIIGALMVTRSDDDVLQARRELGRELFIPDLEHVGIKREVYQRVLAVTGFDWQTWEVAQVEREIVRSLQGKGFGSMGKTEIVTELGPKQYSLKDFKGVFDWLEENYDAVDPVVRIPKTLRKNMHWVNAVLRTVGMKHWRQHSKSGLYQLDLERLAFIHGWFDFSLKFEDGLDESL